MYICLSLFSCNTFCELLFYASDGFAFSQEEHGSIAQVSNSTYSFLVQMVQAVILLFLFNLLLK